jgi:hypothetical protein
MKHFIKRKIWQIKNVFRWLPIIWKQYDFDYRYSIDVFKFQLQKQAEFLESDKSFTLCAKDRAKRIRTVIKLMGKVYEDDYSMEYVDKLKELYGEDVLEVSFVETNDITFNDFSGKTEKLFSMRYKYETWDNADEIEKVKGQLIKESHDKQMRAHKILWSMIEKDIQTWWD